MRIAVPREQTAGETRVAATPETVKKYVESGHEVFVETGAGEAAGHPDVQYTEAGAQVKPDFAACVDGAAVVLKVRKPSDDEIAALPSGCTLIGFLEPLTDEAGIAKLAARNISALAMESVPRTTRAQSMDALSSQATVGGYKAVLLAATNGPKFFPMLTTAAGTVRPAKVFVIGVGVAGLQAIATARRLGAIVSGFDVRPAVREQVESLGAKFVEIDLGTDDAETSGGYAKELTDEQKALQQELMAKTVTESDVVITTAQVPGRKPPELIPENVVDQMQPGSVIVDLAASALGGNVAVSRPGENVNHNGVLVIGPDNLPASMPLHASQLYAKNVANLFELLDDDGNLNVNFDDDIVEGACVTHGGKLAKDGSLAPAKPAEPEPEAAAEPAEAS